MSPIGRTFIVLNLVLAGAFTYFAGDLLKNQNNWKEKYESAQASHQEEVDTLNNRIKTVEDERDSNDSAKIAFENQLAAARNTISSLQDDKKRNEETIASQRTDLKQLATAQESLQSDNRSAMTMAKEAYDASIAAIQAKDEAINAKDAAVAENRQLRNDIAGLNSTIEAKDAAIADLNRDNSEKDLLLAAAYSNGFVNGMAAPELAGTVTNAAGSLLTVSVADNPGNVDIQDIINKLPFRFAIYGDDGYKGDAVATKYEESANAVFCKVVIKKENATIRQGDRAKTNP